MRKLNVIGFIVAFLSIHAFTLVAQEPKSVGEAFYLDENEKTLPLDKEIATHVSGISWSSNSWNAKSLEIPESQSEVRFKTDDALQFVVRAKANDSDPKEKVTIYKLKSKKDKRSIVLSEDNSGTIMKSGDNMRDRVDYQGEAYGESSYLIKVENLKKGEYAIIVSNPDKEDEETTVVACFGIDK